MELAALSEFFAEPAEFPSVDHLAEAVEGEIGLLGAAEEAALVEVAVEAVLLEVALEEADFLAVEEAAAVVELA